MRFYTRAENDARREAAKEFKLVFELVLVGAQIDFYKEDFGPQLSSIATNFFLADWDDDIGFWESRSVYGFNHLKAQVLNEKEVEFHDRVTWNDQDGSISGHDDIWQDLRVRVLDRGTDRRNLWITLWIDEMKIEGDLRTAFGIIEDGVEDDI